MKTDVLIVGSGCSGLYCALQLPEDKKNYLLGYMNGIMDNEKIHSSKKETVSSD